MPTLLVVDKLIGLTQVSYFFRLGFKKSKGATARPLVSRLVASSVQESKKPEFLTLDP